MLALLESVGNFFAPYLPFVSGQNASFVLMAGCLMTGTGIATLAAVSALRLRNKSKGGK